VNLLPWLQGAYCGEPEPALCNTCIADRPSHGARDIVSWRRENAWQFVEADRVICPSEDVRRRLARYGHDARAIVVPHEPVTAGPWPLSPPVRSHGLRVAVIGVLASQKGALAVMSMAEAADPAELSIHVIGDVEQEIPEGLAERIEVTGEYEEADLPALLAKVNAPYGFPRGRRPTATRWCGVGPAYPSSPHASAPSRSGLRGVPGMAGRSEHRPRRGAPCSSRCSAN
jgi:hypothetical protein